MVCANWWVDIEGKGFGPCIDRADACRMAISLAETFGDESRKREVVLMQPKGRHEQIWASWKPVPVSGIPIEVAPIAAKGPTASLPLGS